MSDGNAPRAGAGARGVQITGRTTVVGVMGYPVAHSLSPPMHNAAFAALGLDWVYVPFAVAPADVPAAISGLAALGVRGVNVTIPHKHAVIATLDHVTPAARALGSVNTIVFGANGRVGHSTDGPGFLRGLTARGTDVAGSRAVVLGGGGAARAVVGALATAGAHAITVAARTPERARELPALAAALAPGGVAVVVRSWSEAEEAVRAADVVINATSIGMAGHDPEGMPTPASWLTPGQVVYDLVYTPRETAWLRAAAARGCQTVDGVTMLVHQGAEAFTLWTGVPAPVDVMTAAVLAHLGA